MSKEDLPILDMSNPQHRKVLIDYIKGLRGIHRFEFVKVRDQRSLAQNAYMHGVLFAEIAKGLSEAWGEKVSMLEAKAFLKDRFLRHERINWNSGEIVGAETGHTADLDVPDCTTFIEQCLQFASEQLEINVPLPSEYGTINKENHVVV